MEITPGRAPFSEEEDYTPLRKPKSLANMQTSAAPQGSYNMGSGAMNVAAVVGGVAGIGGGTATVGVPTYNSMAPAVTDAFGRTVSPSKLSPFAKEFVPRFGGEPAGRSQQHQTYQQAQQQQQNFQVYQQQAQQRYANGFQPQGQQAAQLYAQQITSLTASVQERLKVVGVPPGTSSSSNSGVACGVGGGGKVNNYYQQQTQHHNHHQSRYNKQRYHNPHHNHNQQHQQQHHHNKHHHHQQHHHVGASTSGGTGGGIGAADMETIALDYLQTVIQCLNQNPGQFDSIATRFLTIFDGMENNQFVLSVAMEDIFQESIQNPNFRYMGAKLYNLLHMLNLKADSLFHTLLKYKLDYHQQEVLQYMQTNQQPKVRETALFLAELYMQLRGGDDSRIHLIAENIVYSLEQLLTKESTENVRCICLTLKLAGYDLTVDCPAAMQQIIAALDGINKLAPGKYPLAANVIALQKNNWGRKVSSNSLSEVAEEVAAKSSEPLRISDEPVFYGPDGRELTAEEADFLSSDASGNANNVGDSGSDKDDDDDDQFDVGMDAEAEKAYKEFRKLNATT